MWRARNLVLALSCVTRDAKSFWNLKRGILFLILPGAPEITSKPKFDRDTGAGVLLTYLQKLDSIYLVPYVNEKQGLTLVALFARSLTRQRPAKRGAHKRMLEGSIEKGTKIKEDEERVFVKRSCFQTDDKMKANE
jgi:hypothetical protein